ncbi:GNAT family N-acetyltransferase [Psychromicrobium lacuslunae]|uniref:GNAT family N-acetyltransferase n=1 Tax=Psychromicrobium lacuslunae TaxID=1618207 RepID=UPI0005D33D68|nr:GNAT family N-acetyltransferase [Psychromicrobium lacuslunae]
MTEQLEISSLQLPNNLTDSDAADFLEAGLLLDQIRLETWGNRDRISDPETRLVSWRQNDYSRLEVFLGKLGGKIVALSWISLPLHDNLHTGFMSVCVAAEHRKRGYGQLMLETVEKYAAAQGRSVLMSSTEHPADFDPATIAVLEPKSGTGAIPQFDAGVRFSLRHGYQLEQVERFSELRLPIEGAHLEELLRAAEAKAGTDYRLEFWQDRCPERLAESFAVANSRMSTDIPSAGLAVEAETWDIKRLRDMEQRFIEAGHRIDVCAAVHVPSGQIAAYTYFDYNQKKPQLISQEDTLVIREHRGKRLGMLVKAANVRRIQEELPQLEKAITWNAAENDHMLAINIELGFAPAGYDGEWQKDLRKGPANEQLDSD